VEGQHRLQFAEGHQFIWGGGYRQSYDRLENLNPAVLAFIPGNRTLTWANVFAQDQISLRENVELTLGLKLEHNGYTGLESLPTIRLAWKPSSEHLLWTAISRAVRAPSRIDRELFAPGAPPFTIAGGPDFQSEVANVYELGYRAQPSPAMSYSVTLYHHQWDRLRSVEPSPAGATLQNRIDGYTTGALLWANYRVNRAWRLAGGVVVQRERFQRQADSADVLGLPALGNDPSHWWQLRSSMDIGRDKELDVTLRRMGALPNPSVPGYTAVDMRIGWHVRHELELSVAVENLLDRRHAEWGPQLTRSEIGRSVFLKALWRL
jgi:iron complex outermembrane receptor protein